MRAPLEAIPESRLAAVLLRELLPPPREDLDDTYVDIILDDLDLDDDEYASYELVHAAVEPDATETTEFVRVRDTSHDHIVTVPMPRVELDTLPTPRYSEPYEKVDVTLANGVPAFGNALPIPLYSAPFEKVDLDVIPTPVRYEETEMMGAPPSRAARALVTITVLACVLIISASVVWLALRTT
jgi:hypothetical protein